MQHAYVCDFIRTPIGRFGGVLAGVRTDDLAAVPLEELLRRHPFLRDTVDEVFLGCANQAGEDNRDVARMALLLAGFSSSVAGVTLNRLCASGLDALGAASRAIMAGEIDVAIAGGVESMTRSPFVMPKADSAFQRSAVIYDTTIGWRFVNPRMKSAYGVDLLPETAENVAAEHGVSRESQDAYALRSQERSEKARREGLLSSQIVAVDVPAGKRERNRVAVDEHPRPDTTIAALSALKPIVREGGTVTAGNSSGINDGAAALLIASRAAVKRLQLTPLARIAGMASAGVDPRVMGVGPVPAVRKLTERLNWKIRDVDVWEINEAFAAQVLACVRQIGLPDDAEHVNTQGGAIALGHPLGMSGARIAGVAVQELHRRSGKKAIATMCVGVGQGVALALDAPDF